MGEIIFDCLAEIVSLEENKNSFSNEEHIFLSMIVCIVFTFIPKSFSLKLSPSIFIQYAFIFILKHQSSFYPLKTKW